MSPAHPFPGWREGAAPAVAGLGGGVEG